MIIRRPEPPPPTVTERITETLTDSVLRWVAVGLLGAIATGVWYTARVIPMKFQEYDMLFGTQREFNGRVIGILEKHEVRDNDLDDRVRELEKDK